MNAGLKVVVADDAVLLRDGLASLLQRAGMTITGLAGEPAELLRRVSPTQPDVAVIDIKMPPTHTDEGLVAAERIRAEHPGTGVLVLSQYLDVHYAMRLLEHYPTGAGYLLKERVPDSGMVVDAVRRVAAGECIVDPTIVSHLVRPSATRPALADLTEREREVLAMVAEGLSNSGIVALGRGHNRAGAVLLATGAAWFAGSFWDGALYLHRAGVVLLVAGVPAMQRPPVAAWPVLVLGFLVSVDPLATSAAVTVALAVAALVLAADRATAGSERPAVAGCVLCAAAAAIAAVATTATAFSAAGDALLVGYEAAVAGVALAALRCLPAKTAGSSAVAGLVVELGGPARPAPVRDALAEALGDPSLLVAYRVGPGERYVDEQGRPVSVPAASSGRVVTHVGGEAERIAVLAYDPGAIDDPRLADAVAMAARLALVNARLRAQVAVQVEDLRASRRRLLQAADEERARLEQRLHDGAERRLDEVARMLGRARDDARAAGDATGAVLLDAAELELDRARADVRALARGLHPRTLTEHGLRAAVAELAGASPVAVDVAIAAGRFAEPVEATAHFVCAEALANVVKYARASRVTCAATPSDGVLRVIVEDDGVGGTDVTGGTGLRGLADRLSALGGALRVVSPRHGGTIVAAEIPVRGRT